MRDALPVLLALVLVACGPVTGVGDAALPSDTAAALEASPDVPAQTDAAVDAPLVPEASMPDAGPPDALTCATGRWPACGGCD